MQGMNGDGMIERHPRALFIPVYPHPPRLSFPSASLTFGGVSLAGHTIRLRRVFRTTPVDAEVIAVQEGIPETIPPEACHLGWQQSQDLLALLAEAEIPG